MAKQYCIRGHDTFVVGRTQRMCRECRRESDRRRYATEHRQAYKARWWSVTGYLKQLNGRADRALQKVEALFGGR